MTIERGDEEVARLKVGIFTAETLVASLRGDHNDPTTSWYSYPCVVPSQRELGLVCVTNSMWQKLWNVTFDMRL